MKLRINFATRQRLSPWLCLATVVATGWAGWVWIQYSAVSAELTRTQSEIVKVADARARRTRAMNPEPVRIAPERAHAINAAIGQLNVPWLELTEALEAQRTEGITLLAMQPDAAHSSLLIVAEADRADTLADYAQRLATHPPFRSYVPVKQNQVTALGRPRLQLSFELGWAS